MLKRSCSHLLKNYPTFLLAILISCCLPMGAYSQKTTAGWTLDNTLNGVEFYHSMTVCNGQSVVFLKVINKNKYPVKVSWSEKFSTQEGPNIKGFFGPKNLTLNKGESKESNCESKLNKELIIRGDQVQPTYLAEIKKFDYTNVKVSKTI